ncbi:hypothetical protein [Tenacibaculum aiptasiae]|nr:hypothetical protein [Tenacibaculum aiptasiae]
MNLNIEPGTRFHIKNLVKLQEFSNSVRNPMKTEFDVSLDLNGEFIVVKL